MASTLNSDNGIVSGTSGLKTSADSSGVLSLQSSGTTGFTLNTSLALGVGSGNSTGTNGQVLTSSGSNAAPTWATASSGDVVGPASSTDNAIARFDSTTGKLLQNSTGILSDAGAISGLTTIDTTGNITTNGGKYSLKSASVEYGSFSTASGDATLASAASGYLKLVADGALLLGSAAGAEVFRGSSTGLRLTNSLGVGATAPSASGSGITFPASVSDSSDANTLDDYEEGTWTPTITVNTGTATTYSREAGTYTKTGRMVVCLGRVNPSNGTLGSTNGNIRMTGLPFTVGTREGAGAGGNSSNLNGVSALFAYSTTVDAATVSSTAALADYIFVVTYFV